MKHEITSLNTKRTLAESLKNVMKRKSFSKITVSEIIADCGLNRKTFYYHFEDIFALLKWMFESEAIEVVKQFNLLVEYEEALAFIMDYIEKNDYILSCAYDAIGREQMSASSSRTSLSWSRPSSTAHRRKPGAAWMLRTSNSSAASIPRRWRACCWTG